MKINLKTRLEIVSYFKPFLKLPYKSKNAWDLMILQHIGDLKFKIDYLVDYNKTYKSTYDIIQDILEVLSEIIPPEELMEKYVAFLFSDRQGLYYEEEYFIYNIHGWVNIEKITYCDGIGISLETPIFTTKVMARSPMFI